MAENITELKKRLGLLDLKDSLTAEAGWSFSKKLYIKTDCGKTIDHQRGREIPNGCKGESKSIKQWHWLISDLFEQQRKQCHIARC